MFVLYLLTESGGGENKKTFWNRAGCGFENRDGSINVKIDIFPGLTFQLREKEEKKEG